MVSAEYSDGEETRSFSIDPSAVHTTRGTTNKSSLAESDPSHIDRDAPSVPKNTYLGELRSKVTTLQDDVNVYLTKKMQQQQQAAGVISESESEPDDENDI